VIYWGVGNLRSEEKWTSRYVAFIAMMGALGNALFAMSSQVLTIPGGITGIALDLSNLGVVVAAVFGGPVAGLATGIIAGILPGLWFGFLGGHSGLLALFGLPIGKAIAGFSIGFLCEYLDVLKKRRKSLKTVFLVILGFIPEMLFIALYFSMLMPYFVGFFVGWVILVSILVKGVAEMAVIGIITGALVGNSEFVTFLEKYFNVPLET